jgi:hypothetical protein
MLPELHAWMPYSPAVTAKRTFNSRCEIDIAIGDSEPALRRRRRRNPTKRIIAHTTFTMAAVYENLSSDLVWQVVRTLPTKENTPPWEEFVLGDICHETERWREMLCFRHGARGQRDIMRAYAH